MFWLKFSLIQGGFLKCFFFEISFQNFGIILDPKMGLGPIVSVKKPLIHEDLV